MHELKLEKTWQDYVDITDVPEVLDVMKAFVEDSNENNAVFVVKAIEKALENALNNLGDKVVDAMLGQLPPGQRQLVQAATLNAFICTVVRKGGTFTIDVDELDSVPGQHTLGLSVDNEKGKIKFFTAKKN